MHCQILKTVSLRVLGPQNAPAGNLWHAPCCQCATDFHNIYEAVLATQTLECDALCREAVMGHELDSPQQFGIWVVAGLGLVVAFRGTASAEDVFIDTNIEPVPLNATGGTRGECLEDDLHLRRHHVSAFLEITSEECMSVACPVLPSDRVLLGHNC